MVGKQAEASSTSGVGSALRNTRGRPVRTFVAVMKSLIGAVARRVAVGQHGGIHGTRRGARNGLDREPRFLEKSVQYPPGERAMRPTALQRKIDQLRCRPLPIE